VCGEVFVAQRVDRGKGRESGRKGEGAEMGKGAAGGSAGGGVSRAKATGVGGEGVKGVGGVGDLKGVGLGRAADEELMRRTAEGDQQAYAILYERYHQAVLSYLYRMLGNVEDVEAIGQEVFLRAFRFAKTYRYPQKFSTWLFTITRNLAINQARRKKRAPVRTATELGLAGGEDSGDVLDVAGKATADPAEREEIARVLAALDELPADQKEVIMMGVFQDLSYNEMEEITGTKAVTLRSRMFHALKRLGKMMS